MIPVIVGSAEGSLAPQAMSLQVHFDRAVGEVTIQRAGAAKGAQPSFEISRRSGNDLSYLVSFSGNDSLVGDSHSAVVAEIEVAALSGARVGVSIDPKLTMLVNQGGTMKATVAAHTLQLAGTTIGNVEVPAGPKPQIRQ